MMVSSSRGGAGYFLSVCVSEVGVLRLATARCSSSSCASCRRRTSCPPLAAFPHLEISSRTVLSPRSSPNKIRLKLSTSAPTQRSASRALGFANNAFMAEPSLLSFVHLIICHLRPLLRQPVGQRGQIFMVLQPRDPVRGYGTQSKAR